MKLLSLQKLKTVLNYCDQSDNCMLSKYDMQDLLETFGDDYFVSGGNDSMECIKKSDFDYKKGWKFR